MRGAGDLGLGDMLEVRGDNAPAEPALEPGHTMIGTALQSVITPEAMNTSFDAREPSIPSAEGWQVLVRLSFGGDFAHLY